MSEPPRISIRDDDLIHTDDALVAVEKAAGQLCDASRDPNRDHLGAALSRWAARRGESESFFAAHRLDLGTSGVVLFARTKTATTALMRQFQERRVAKQYEAVVHRPPDWAVGTTLDRRTYLRHRKGRSEEVRSGGKVAQTRFEVAAIDGDLALVRALPATGRTHQLRVHLAAVGAPIVGDDRYGRAERGRLWLHARSIEVDHPEHGGRLLLESRSALHLEGGAAVESYASRP